MSSAILDAIDREIAQLREARALLSGHRAATQRRKVGRPAKVALPVVDLAVTPAKKKKRNLTPEGRKRIAEAVRRRWAAQKKAAAGK